MKQNYTKNKKNYKDNLFFDNDLYENEAELSQFNLEKLASNAAQQMIQQALELEVAEFLERGKYQKTNPDDFGGYRTGHHNQRTIATSFGSLEVKGPRVSDNREKFQSNLVKKYRRRSEGLDCLFPNLFVEGLATRDACVGVAISGRRGSTAFTLFDFPIAQKVHATSMKVGENGICRT